MHSKFMLIGMPNMRIQLTMPIIYNTWKLVWLTIGQIFQNLKFRQMSKKSINFISICL